MCDLCISNSILWGYSRKFRKGKLLGSFSRSRSFCRSLAGRCAAIGFLASGRLLAASRSLYDLGSLNFNGFSLFCLFAGAAYHGSGSNDNHQR